MTYLRKLKYGKFLYTRVPLLKSGKLKQEKYLINNTPWSTIKIVLSYSFLVLWMGTRKNKDFHFIILFYFHIIITFLTNNKFKFLVIFFKLKSYTIVFVVSLEKWILVNIYTLFWWKINTVAFLMNIIFNNWTSKDV